MQSAMVPLDRVLQSSYRLPNAYSNNSAISSGLATICNANFASGTDPQTGEGDVGDGTVG